MQSHKLLTYMDWYTFNFFFDKLNQQDLLKEFRFINPYVSGFPVYIHLKQKHLQEM